VVLSDLTVTGGSKKIFTKEMPNW